MHGWPLAVAKEEDEEEEESQRGEKHNGRSDRSRQTNFKALSFAVRFQAPNCWTIIQRLLLLLLLLLLMPAG